MRTTIAALSFGGSLGLIACQSATAMPVAAGAMQQSAAVASTLQQAQYSERRGRGHITKCYREFVVGNYVCRTYRSW